ncbi:Syntaxin-7 isoform 1 [Schistosoma japonicum]|uniref:Syntaxin-7 isoform 1 n=1 Tax=Schistosoma japonicum TaxID=6182 RepID=A0A4Z2DN71_SCHJA|nr:Syntaxin-7 isoform 1 [Schistosoma japonicum]
MYSEFNSNTGSSSQASAVIQVFEDISSKILKIRLLANELETLNKSISITGNSKEKSDLLNKREKDALDLVDETKNLFINLSKEPFSDQITKIHVEKLKVDFQRVLHRFQRTQAEIKRRLLTESRPASSLVEDLINFESNDTDEGLPIQAQCITQDYEVQELGRVLNQEDQMRSIEEDIVNVNAIIHQVSKLIYEQRVAVDSLEDNIEVALTNEQSAHSELTRASDRRQRSRRCCCIFVAMLIVAILIVIIVLIIEYPPRRTH